MEKHSSHFFCSESHNNGVPNRISFVLLRNHEEALELVRNILREVAAERSPVYSGHTMPLGAGRVVTMATSTRLWPRGAPNTGGNSEG